MKKQFWFVVGSQDLYGDETLKEVASQTEEIVNALNESDKIGYDIVLKDIVTTADEITNLMKEVNYNDDVIGVITWMHTFSPAKMWIQGTKLLQKPLLHFATQYNVNIPWDTIDMDYMNLNQSAHGDREYGYINARLNKNNKIIFGHWKDEEVQSEIGKWMQVAVGYIESHNIKVARFGDNMRDVAVTEGDKIEAAIKFGWTVDYYGIGDLVEVMNSVSQSEIDDLYEEYQELYEFDNKGYSDEEFADSVKEQAKIEIALKRFLNEKGYNAFTTNFEDLHGMKQLPGLAVQRLMSDGYGFAGEGDWKTAAISRLLKVMTNNQATGFMEDYTYELGQGKEAALQAHMLEVDPTLSADKLRVVVAPLGIGGKADPARLVFDGREGEGVVVTMADFGDGFKVIMNEVDLFTPEVEAPNLPVARVMWKPRPSLKESVTKWIEAGGGHHTVVTLGLSSQQLVDLAEMFNIDYVLIK